MPLNGQPPPYMNPRPTGLPPAMAQGAPGGYTPPAPSGYPGMLGMSPRVEGQMPTGAMPPGVQTFEDGSMLFSPDAVRTIFANQAGGPAIPQGPPPVPGGGMMPGGMPPGLGGPPPPDFGAPPGLLGPGMGGGPPMAGPPAGAPPFLSGRMPGQPPPMPTDPAGMAMAGPPPVDTGPPPLPALPPSPGVPPRSEWPTHLNATAPSSSKPSPLDRLRGEKKPGIDRRRR